MYKNLPLFISYIFRKKLLLSGKILPSRAANGDAAHGDGVYLTTLEPRLGRDTVQNNNWSGNRDKKMEAYVEIFLPSSKVITD